MRKPVRTTPTESPVRLPANQDPLRKLQLKQACAQLLGLGVPRDRLIPQLLAMEPEFSESEARKVYYTVLREWRDDYAAESAYHRSSQVRRLMNDLSRMRSETGKDGKPRIKWSSVTRHEELLSKILGTQTPLRVQVMDVREEMKEAVASVIGNMSDDDIDSLITEGTDVTSVQQLGSSS